MNRKRDTNILENLDFPSYDDVRSKIAKKLTKKAPSKPKDLPDGVWSQQSLRVLEERYLRKDEKGTITETPEDMCWRVAWEMASAEVLWGANKKKVRQTASDYYQMLVTKKFLPNSPTLMNAGTDNGLQYSACFVLPVEDSLEGIFDAIKYQALIHQTGGGTGFAFSRLRPRGSIVKSSRGVASGPVSFMKIFDAATNEIKQGGKRRGANMGVLRVDHPDILEFIHCKDKGGITNFNISVAITDEFMKALETDGVYDLISVRYDSHGEQKQVVGSLAAKKVWQEIVKGAWTTGDPGLIFIDRINKSSANPVPGLGPIEGTNPCVVGETLVSTQKGLVSIENLFKENNEKSKSVGLVLDNRVFDLKKKGTVKGRAIKYFDNGVKETLKIITKMGFELTGTLDHKILTPSGWKKLETLSVGDDVLIQSGKGSFSTEKLLPFNPKSPSYPNRWSEQLGEALGWLIGDGWLRRGDRNCRVGWTFGNKDRENFEYFKPIINKWYGKDINEVVRERDTIHLSYHSEDFVDFFYRLGVKNVKALNKVVPETIYQAPRESVIGFLRGLFTADGTVNFKKDKNSYVRLTSKSIKLLRGVQLLLLNLGIVSKIYDRSRPPRKGVFSYKDKNGEYKKYDTDGILYELQISRKSVVIFIDEIGFLNYRHKKLIRSFKTKDFYRDQYQDSIVSIKPSGKKRVFDLTEQVSYTFITNGLISYDCGEQPLYPYDSCNLGSIFLDKFVVKDNGKYQIDWEGIKETARMATRFLDSVIEMNPYPLPQIRQTSLAVRRIGLGVGGWADMLMKLEIPYASDQAIKLAEEIMRIIHSNATRESEVLAQERGAFPLWGKSIYKKKTKRRNSTITTIAPTGSISIIAGSSSGIEPVFALAFRHIVKDESLDRTMSFVNPIFIAAMKEKGLWSKELEKQVTEKGHIGDSQLVDESLKRIFQTSHEIDYSWHVRVQSAFQKYTDNAVSKTINLIKSATYTDIEKAYKMAWETNCMGVTVFRDGCKENQVLNAGVSVTDKKQALGYEKETKNAKPLMDRPFAVQGATYRLDTPVGTAFITINEDENSQPIELFINVGKAGSDVQAMAEALGRTISTTLRLNGYLQPRERAKEVALQLAGIGGRRSVGFGKNKILSLPDAIAYALSNHFGFKVNGFLSDKVDNQHSFDSEKEINGQINQQSNGEIDKIDHQQQDTQQKLSAIRQEGQGKWQFPLFESESADSKDICPTCGASAFVYQEGCSKCYSCGYSEC